jgi:hypothetical protein
MVVRAKFQPAASAVLPQWTSSAQYECLSGDTGHFEWRSIPPPDGPAIPTIITSLPLLGRWRRVSSRLKVFNDGGGSKVVWVPSSVLALSGDGLAVQEPLGSLGRKPGDLLHRMVGELHGSWAFEMRLIAGVEVFRGAACTGRARFAACLRRPARGGANGCIMAAAGLLLTPPPVRRAPGAHCVLS